MSARIFIEPRPEGLRVVRQRRDGLTESVLPWRPASHPSLTATLADAGFKIKKAAIIVPRSELILFTIEEETDELARRTLKRLLPDAPNLPAWVRRNTRLAVWPDGRYRRAIACLAEAGIRFDGAVVADGILPGASLRAPAWVVPPRGWRVDAPSERALVALAALAVATAVLTGRAASDAEMALACADRAYRASIAAARTDQPSQSLPVLAEICARLPPGACLIDLVIDEMAHLARIRGRAADYAGVSAITEALSTSPLLGTMRPGHATLVKVGGRSVVEFTVEAPFL